MSFSLCMVVTVQHHQLQHPSPHLEDDRFCLHLQRTARLMLYRLHRLRKHKQECKEHPTPPIQPSRHTHILPYPQFQSLYRLLISFVSVLFSSALCPYHQPSLMPSSRISARITARPISMVNAVLVPNFTTRWCHQQGNMHQLYALINSTRSYNSMHQLNALAQLCWLGSVLREPLHGNTRTTRPKQTGSSD